MSVLRCTVVATPGLLHRQLSEKFEELAGSALFMPRRSRPPSQSVVAPAVSGSTSLPSLRGAAARDAVQPALQWLPPSRLHEPRLDASALEARYAELNAKCEALRAGDGECDNDDDD